MKRNFQECLDHVLAFEGGYVDDPDDPGGETNFGISKRAHPNEDIKNMTVKRAGEIYRAKYWNAVRGDELPDGIDLVMFDAAVNSGPARSIRWVQKAVGLPDDGILGPQTMGRIMAYHDRIELIEIATGYRMAFLKSLGTWWKYQKGWTRRVDTVRMVAFDISQNQNLPQDQISSIIAQIIEFIMSLIRSLTK